MSKSTELGSLGSISKENIIDNMVIENLDETQDHTSKKQSNQVKFNAKDSDKIILNMPPASVNQLVWKLNSKYVCAAGAFVIMVAFLLVFLTFIMSVNNQRQLKNFVQSRSTGTSTKNPGYHIPFPPPAKTRKQISILGHNFTLSRSKSTETILNIIEQLGQRVSGMSSILSKLASTVHKLQGKSSKTRGNFRKFPGRRRKEKSSLQDTLDEHMRKSDFRFNYLEDSLQKTNNEIDELEDSMETVLKRTQPCPFGWIKFVSQDDTACYYFSDVNETMNVLNASNWCGEFEADLVRINSLEENNFVTSNANFVTFKNANGSVAWLGLRSAPIPISNEVGWRWLLDDTVLVWQNRTGWVEMVSNDPAFTLWATKEPKFASNGHDHCGLLRRVLTKKSETETDFFVSWATDDCDKELTFICEKKL